MTIDRRIEAFKVAFAKWPASWPQLVREQDRDVLYATWLLGNDYRNKTKYYGAYPPGYLDRVMALFPDVVVEAANEKLGTHSAILHVFSGSLPPGRYERCDVTQDAELRCSVYNLPNVILNWKPLLVLADPPYSATDAVNYGTSMIDRRRALAALAAITRPGGHLVWLDTCWPMHRKAEWVTVGRITIVRSTNHRVRMATIFERAA
jgi:hypothetical protein